MSKELVISANRHETKLAILEDDQLVEVYFQRTNEYSLAGSIHKGRVTRVLPGMQSAFVDLGLERDTFLYVSDFLEEAGEDIDRIPADEPARVVEEPPPAAAEASEQVQEASQPSATERNAERERSEEGEGRDRRTRRSRRRRSRGRGFPESKYAAPETAASTAPSAAEESPDFAVLPGESLAKYSASGEEEQGGEDTEAVEDHSFARAEDLSAAGSDGRERDVDAGEENGDEASLRPDMAVIANDNPEEQPPANAIPDAPEHPDAAEEEYRLSAVAQRKSRKNEPDEPESPPQETSSADATETDSDTESEAASLEHEESAAEDPEPLAAGENESDGDENDETAGASSDDEDREIQALILEGDAGDVETAHPEAGAKLSANVREQGGRYMHRVSRRMRRRSRGSASEIAAPARPEHRPEHHKPQHQPAARPEKTPLPSIAELLKEGQEIIVQIAKEPLGQKGARITSHIALPGRYIVYMPTLDHMGVSRKIASDDERQRLKRILQKHKAGVSGGFIIRTAGEGRTENEIAADMNFLANLWLDIRQKAEKRPAPTLLHHDLDIVQRVMRDQLNESYKAIWVDNEDVYESTLRFLQRFQPAMVSRVKMYTRPAPIFDAFSITQELEKALRPKVWLKSGGYIVINQTEALVAIDVNTGKFVGKSNRLEDTIVKTNTEAIKEIVRQIRLRDLGGIIVIDFIDMDERKNRQKVMQTLEEAMRADRAPCKILQFNDFGLVAITRKRVKQSLERTLCSPCPYCEGSGYVKSVQTIIGEMLTEAHKIAAALEGQKEAMLRVHPDVAKVLKSNANRYLEELEGILKRPVLVTSDPQLHHEKFDLM